MTELYSILTQPEEKWTRYDYKNSIFTYRGTTSDYGNCIGLLSASATITFSFVGSAIRIIAGTRDNFRATNVKIKIDGGMEESITTLRGTGDIGYVLVYEKQMDYGNHNATITVYDGASSRAFVFYGIDTYEIENKTLILHDGEYKRYIEGKDAVSGTNLIPVMINDTNPVPYVSSCKDSYGGFFSFNAFNRILNGASRWIANSSSDTWIKIDLSSPRKAYTYQLTSGHITQQIKSWILQGSNDDNLWIDLDEVNEHPLAIDSYEKFTIDNPDNYRYYRIFVKATVSGFASLSGFTLLTQDIPEVKEKWEDVTNTIPTKDEFVTKGMDSLSILDRTVAELESLPMAEKSEILGTGEIGKVFSKTIDLKKYFDIRSIKIEVK
ncbi:discoidin domain-containing protein [Lysinibacillus parviboronicapiens]|uniref:discoidin domain-containing protein n=1 Tax=Lysinibacillus parviboronicapiens TaxID=436516 RepID=UPI0006D19EA7|nr:discoidin domain-containing protein [Lysinibacillus parviboronicapiens]